MNALGAHLPGARLSGGAAGLHAIAELPQRYGQEGFLARTAAAGVDVRALSRYTHARVPHDDGPVRLVPGYAHLSPPRIREGVRLMARAMASG